MEKALNRPPPLAKRSNDRWFMSSNGWKGAREAKLGSAEEAWQGAAMSTLAEIEKAIPQLTASELAELERVVRQARQEKAAHPPDWLHRAVGKATSGLSTDEIMRMTRGED